MNVKALIPLIAGLVVGLLALKLGSDYLHKAQGATTTAPKLVQVWAAGQDISRGQAITEEMLRTASFEASSVPGGTFTDKAKVVGRVARASRVPGDLLFEDSLMPPGALPGLPVPEGYRAVGVKIDESSGVDYHLEPSCRVDVVAYFTVDNRGNNSTVARTIIEDVEVGAVGPRISAVEGAKADEKQGSQAEERVVRAVTLFVRPTDVPLLFLAESRGRIKLSLRSDADAGTVGQSKAVNEQRLMSDHPARNADSGEEGNWWTNVFGGSQPKPPTTAAPPPPPQALPSAPSWAQKTVVYQGARCVVLGWQSLDSTQPVEITPDGTPSGTPPASRTATHTPAPAPAPAAPVQQTNAPAPKEPAE